MSDAATPALHDLTAHATHVGETPARRLSTMAGALVGSGIRPRSHIGPGRRNRPSSAGSVRDRCELARGGSGERRRIAHGGEQAADQLLPGLGVGEGPVEHLEEQEAEADGMAEGDEGVRVDVVVDPAETDTFTRWREVAWGRPEEVHDRIALAGLASCTVYECTGVSGLLADIIDKGPVGTRILSASGADSDVIPSADAHIKGVNIQFGGGPAVEDWYDTLDLVVGGQIDPATKKAVGLGPNRLMVSADPQGHVEFVEPQGPVLGPVDVLQHRTRQPHRRPVEHEVPAAQGQRSKLRSTG